MRASGPEARASSASELRGHRGRRGGLWVRDRAPASAGSALRTSLDFCFSLSAVPCGSVQAREWRGGLVPPHGPHAKAQPQPGADVPRFGRILETYATDSQAAKRDGPHARMAGKLFLVQSCRGLSRRPAPQRAAATGFGWRCSTYNMSFCEHFGCSTLLTGVVLADRSPSTSAGTASTWLLVATRRERHLYSTNGLQFTGIGMP